MDDETRKQIYESTQQIGRQNLQHVLDDNCTDPDCELHNPSVGIAEETVDLTDLAFYVAGYLCGAARMGDQYDEVKGNIRDEIQQIINPREGGSFA